MVLKDLKGKRFGMWTVLEPFEKKKEGTYWICRCDCGNISNVHGGNLIAGRSKSCGCQRGKQTISRFTKHKGSKTRLYVIYNGIKSRCFNKNNPAYYRYGGRGITMCEEWVNSFELFREWSLNNGYDDKLSIDRIDVNGNYEPNNCRWSTPKEQGNNTRKNLIFQIDGKQVTLSQLCEKANMKYSTVYYRINHGLSLQDALDRNYYSKK